ncbi:MAG: Uma2 family endonuclease [Solirubrobacteraceae bacterium]
MDRRAQPPRPRCAPAAGPRPLRRGPLAEHLALRYDVGRMRAVYEQAGLPELWLVDTSAETVLVFRRSTPSAPIFDVALELTREETLRSPQLAGFAAQVGDLFPTG